MSESRKARLEFDAPQSCGKCAAFYDYHEYCCALNKRAGTDKDGYDPFAGRLLDCPLKIVPETPEGELKPCPFCGGKAIMDYIEPHAHSERLAKIMPDYKGAHFIECTGCTCALSLGNDRNAAIAAWNRRA